MSANYDNWERLVAAVLKKQQLWELFHDHSRSPSILSEASDFSKSSFNSTSPLDDLAFDLARLGSSSKYYHKTPKLVLISDFSPSIIVKDVHLESSEFLGRGTFGAAYAAAVGNNGVKIVVKRLKPIDGISETEFSRQMTIAGNIRHENVAALRAYYYSEYERLMLYDYYSTGSVYALLHGGNGEPRADVDWESRVRIAVGAARGIAETHRHEVVHGNIKSSNVFRNPDKYGCVSDLGPTNLVETTFTQTAHCYAPEVKNTRDVSQASDVYSFGILLLELLTRKPTIHVPGGPPAVNLVKLVTSITNRMRAANVFDADLLQQPTVKEQMVKMLKIGLKCVEKSVKKRPKMFEVVKMLEEITVLNPIVANKLVFIDDSYNKFNLEDMLKATAEVLGKGTFGNTYKAILETGNTVAVKRLKNSSVTLNYFQQQMEIIGRMRHKNVAEVKAYYFNKDEKLLVYDYYNQDNSISALLHGKIGTAKTPLDLKTRMRIAVGAARGIAHIHLQHGHTFVHGNVKSSNIFLNGQTHVVRVSDAGLAKLTIPISRSGMLTPGYCAPEVTDSRKVSQASDIYSFGVLLLELLTGKPSQSTDYDDVVTSLGNWFHFFDRDEWAAKVVDRELLRFEIKEETCVRLLQIAKHCISDLPKLRPTMSEVVRMLEDISGIKPINEPELDDNAWEQLLSMESNLKDLLEDLLPSLTP